NSLPLIPALVKSMFFITFLGAFAIPAGMGKLKEDVHLDILDLHCPRHCGNPPCDIHRKPVHHGSLVMM
ncbi:MAG: hypothetical protein NTW33_11550, partial [Methanoregula sp.]|nr:hypothetical protein [Methanoregula sp.]